MSLVSKRYSQALFACAIQKGKAENYLTVLQTTNKAISKLPAHFFKNPRITRQEQSAFLQTLFQGDDQELLQFFTLLCKRGHMGELPAICRDFEALVLENKNILRAELRAAFHPTDDALAKIKTALKKRFQKDDILLHCTQDASLIGGFTVKAGGILWDKSVKGALMGLSHTIQPR